MVVTTSVMAAVFLLLGIGMIWLAVQRGAALWPAPTPTPTAGPSRTPTPDKRATFVAEDMLTQAAFTATVAQPPTPVASQPTTAPPPEDVAATAAATPQPPGTSIAMLPIILAEQATAPPFVASPTFSSVYVPNVSGAQPSATVNPAGPTATTNPLLPATATVTPVPGMLPTDTPSPMPPTPTFTPSPTFTPAPLTVSEMPASVNRTAEVYVGPSSVYTFTPTITVNQGTAISLRGRTPAGDWVYACCLSDARPFWIRPAYVDVANNVLPTAAPTDADPENLRWLALQAPDPALTPRPVAPSVQPGDYPLARYDAANTGRVPALPSGGLNLLWPQSSESFQSGSPFSSPMIVQGGTVAIFNSDQNFYGLFWDGGNQRWKYNVQTVVNLWPALADNVMYSAYGSTLLALQDQNSAIFNVGQTNLEGTANTPVSVMRDMVLVGTAESRLIIMKRSDLNVHRFFDDPAGTIQMPAFGQETIYVGADRVYAIDANLFDRPDRQQPEVIWIASIGPINSPPVYAYPGVKTLAELYVSQGTLVHLLDANTGVELRNYEFGAQITAMALNNDSIIVAGNGQLHKMSRDLTTRFWGVNFSGTVIGGPLVTDRAILLVTQEGSILLYDAANGAVLDASKTVPGGILGGPVVSNQRIFIASGNAVYAFQGNP